MSDSIDYIVHSVRSAGSFEEAKSTLLKWAKERDSEAAQRGYESGHEDAQFYMNETQNLCD